MDIVSFWCGSLLAFGLTMLIVGLQMRKFKRDMKPAKMALCEECLYKKALKDVTEDELKNL